MDNNEIEIWKAIEGSEKRYFVSNFGNVKRNFKKEKILKGRILNGYKRVALYLNKKPKDFFIHCLVAELFLGPRPLNFVVDHIDENKLNNKLGNLQYLNVRSNISKSKRGKYFTGVYCSKAAKKHPYIAKYEINGISTHIGCFSTEIEASNAYQNKIKEINLNLQLHEH